LEYGCVVYGSARQSVLESLDRVQNAALRTCLGAYRTSPVAIYTWKRENCPLNYDVNICVYNISVNFDQIHATLLSIVYLILASDACLRLDQIPSPHIVSDWINLLLTQKSTSIVLQ